MSREHASPHFTYLRQLSWGENARGEKEERYVIPQVEHHMILEDRLLNNPPVCLVTIKDMLFYDILV